MLASWSAVPTGRSTQHVFVTVATAARTAVRICVQVGAEMVSVNVENASATLVGKEQTVKLQKSARVPLRRDLALETVFANMVSVFVTSDSKAKVAKSRASARTNATKMVSAGRANVNATQDGLVKLVVNFRTKKPAKACPRRDHALETVFVSTAAVCVPHSSLEKIARLRRSALTTAVATENASWDNACAILDMREKPVKRTFHVTATERVSAKADNAIVFQVTKGNLAKRRVFAQTNVVAMVYVPVQHATVFQDGLGTAAQRIPKKQKSKLV